MDCIPENGEENLEFLIAVARYQKLKYLFLRRIHGHHIMKKFMREGARNEIYIPGHREFTIRAFWSLDINFL